MSSLSLLFSERRKLVEPRLQVLVFIDHGPERESGGHRVECRVGDARRPALVRATELGRRVDGVEPPRDMLVQEGRVLALEGEGLEVASEVNEIEPGAVIGQVPAAMTLLTPALERRTRRRRVVTPVRAVLVLARRPVHPGVRVEDRAVGSLGDLGLGPGQLGVVVAEAVRALTVWLDLLSVNQREVTVFDSLILPEAGSPPPLGRVRFQARSGRCDSRLRIARQLGSCLVVRERRHFSRSSLIILPNQNRPRKERQGRRG